MPDDLSAYLDPAPRAPRGAKLSSSQIADTLRQAGWDERHIPTMTAIAQAESSGNPQAHNPKYPDDSYGLLQVNRLAHPQFSPETLKDPVGNAKAALDVFKRQGLNAWSTYKTGAYKRFLNQSQHSQTQKPTSDLDSYLDPISTEQTPPPISLQTKAKPSESATPPALASPAPLTQRRRPSKPLTYSGTGRAFGKSSISPDVIRAGVAAAERPSPQLGSNLIDRSVPDMVGLLTAARNSPEAQQREAIRQEVVAERAKRRVPFATLGGITELVTNPQHLFQSEESIVNDEVANRLHQQQLAREPEVTAIRKEYGAMPAAERSVAAPLARGGASVLNLASGLASLGGYLPKGYIPAADQLSEWAKKRAEIIETGAGLSPLKETDAKTLAEVERSVPEKVATGIADLGVGLGEIILLKKATKLPFNQLLALEGALKNSDKPVAQQAGSAAQGYALGSVLEQNLSRPASAALFGVPTGLQTGYEVSQGRMSPLDAAIQTGIQAGAGAVLGGKRESPMAARLRDIAATEPAPSQAEFRPVSRGGLRERMAQRGQQPETAITPSAEAIPKIRSATSAQPETVNRRAEQLPKLEKYLDEPQTKVQPPVEAQREAGNIPDWEFERTYDGQDIGVSDRVYALQEAALRERQNRFGPEPPELNDFLDQMGILKAEASRRGDRDKGRAIEVIIREHDPSLADAPSSATTIDVTPQEASQRFYHRDYGEVTESPNQKRVGKGRIRVIADDGSEHVIKRAAMTGAGNQRAVPVKSEPAAEPEGGKKIEIEAPVPTDALAAINRTFNQMVGPDIYDYLPKNPTAQDVIQVLADVGLSDQIMQEATPKLRKLGYSRIGDVLITDEGLRFAPKELSPALAQQQVEPSAPVSEAPKPVESISPQPETAAPSQKQNIEVGDDVSVNLAGRNETVTVHKIVEDTAYFDYFGTKSRPLSELTLEKKSQRNINAAKAKSDLEEYRTKQDAEIEARRAERAKSWQTADERTSEFDKQASTAFTRAHKQVERLKAEQAKIKPSASGYSASMKAEYEKLQAKIDAAQGVMDTAQKYAKKPQAKVAAESVTPEAASETAATRRAAREGEAGAVDVDLLTLGIRPFAKEVAEKGRSGIQGVKDISDGIKSILAPATRGPEARTTAAITRANASEMARAHDIAEKSLEGARNYFSKQKPDANYDFIDRMERGQAQPDPNTQKFADALRDLLDERRDQIRALGTGKLESFIKDYFPHIWKDPTKAKTFFGQGRRPLEGTKSFLKERTIPFTKDGLAFGLEPVSNNPVDLAVLKLREMDKYLMAHKTMMEMKENGLLKFIKSSERLPEGYKKIDDRVATVFGGPSSRPEGGQLIRGYYVAPEPAAKILNNYLSPGLEATALRTPYRAWRATANLMNQAQLGFSFFHGGFTTLDAMVSRTAAGLEDIFRHGKPLRGIATIASTPISPLTNLAKGSKVLSEWYKPGSQGAEIAKLTDAMQEAGGRARMDRFYTNDAVTKFKDVLKQGNLIGAALRLPSAAIEKATAPVMEWLVPRQKAGIFAEMAKRELERLGPSATREQTRQALAKAWDSVDNRMGQMVYDNIFWNKVTKDLAMASVRSVGWNLGTAREVAGGLVDYATLPKRALSKGRTEPLFTHKMAYATALPLVVGTMGAMTQYLLTGKGPEELKDYFFPKTGLKDENGNDERIAFPSYMKDIFHFKEEPTKVVGSKLHPLISTIGEMLSNRDYYGTKIRNEDDPVVQQAKDVAKHLGKSFVPFSVRGYQKEAERGAPLRRKVLPFIGITPAPSYINQTPAEKLMSKLTEERMPAGSRTKEEAERSQLRHKLQTLIRKGQNVDQQIQEGVDKGILKPDDARGIQRDAKQLPVELRFKRLGAKDAINVYRIMSSTERAIVKDELEKKYRLIESLPLDEQEKVRSQYRELGIGQPAGSRQRPERPSRAARPARATRQ